MITEYVNIKQITASIGGYFGSSYIVEVEFVNGKITYEVREDGAWNQVWLYKGTMKVLLFSEKS